MSIPWDKAPAPGTPERRAFYDYFKLAYDDTINQDVPAANILPESPALSTPKPEIAPYIKAFKC